MVNNLLINNLVSGAVDVGVRALVIKPNTAPADNPLYVSSTLGTNVMSDLDFQQGDYYDVDGVHRAFQAMKFETVLFNVTQVKTIIKTPMLGVKGSIKQFICDGDYEINIIGKLIASNGKRPKELLSALKSILDAPIPLAVNSYYLNELGIYSILVESAEYPQNAGEYSQQTFSIRAYSDSPVILYVNA